jgi:hypothetical protein
MDIQDLKVLRSATGSSILACVYYQAGLRAPSPDLLNYVTSTASNSQQGVNLLGHV